MKLSYDPAKRAATLAERGLDFEDAPKLFAGPTYTAEDDRFDYGETRYITYGYVDDRAVVMVWTERGDSMRVISMRHAHEEEMSNVRLG